MLIVSSSPIDKMFEITISFTKKVRNLHFLRNYRVVGMVGLVVMVGVVGVVSQNYGF